MEITCVACAQPMTVTDDRIGQSVECPSCHSTLLLHRADQLLKESLVTCPGCAVKLALPDANAEIFRCPKCSQNLREPRSQSLTEIWRQQDPTVAYQARQQDPTVAYQAIEPPPPTSHPGLVPRSRASRKRSVDYASNIQTAAPGGLLCAQALIALFINGFQLLATQEITDQVADADTLRTRFISTAIFGAIYQLPILIGSIQMILGQHVWLGKTVSIMAVIPVTVITYGVYWRYFAIFLYPVALIGGIWGIIELFRSAPSQAR